MMKNNILFIISFLLSGVLFAQESITFIADRDNIGYIWSSGDTILLSAGDSIITGARISYGTIFKDSQEFDILIIFENSNTDYSAIAKFIMR
jgi:hypothetical protein